VLVTGTREPAVAKEALTEALTRITSQIQEQTTVALLPPEGMSVGLLDQELEVDEQGNLILVTKRSTQ